MVCAASVPYGPTVTSEAPPSPLVRVLIPWKVPGVASAPETVSVAVPSLSNVLLLLVRVPLVTAKLPDALLRIAPLTAPVALTVALLVSSGVVIVPVESSSPMVTVYLPRRSECRRCW